MSQVNHIPQDDLALFALQALTEKEHADIFAHLSQCDECTEELARIQGDLAVSAFTVEMHSPPAYARERLMRKIATEKKPVPIRQTRGGLITEAGRPSNLRMWSGWAVAAALGGFSVLQYTHRQQAETALTARVQQMETQSAHARDVLETLTDSRAKQVGLRPASAEAGDKGADAHAAYMADKGALVFFASKLAPLQPYKTYELWLLPANGREPIAAGVFKPDANGNANVVMPNLPKGVPAAGFGVTIEDEAGSKQPTLPIVMSGS
jgi:hypothetical protein